MEKQLILRDADTADTDDLALLMNELGYPTTAEEMKIRFEAIVDHPDYKTLLAVFNEEIVAMAGLIKGRYYEKNGCYVRMVAFVVKQANRNKGIGKVLIRAVEEWAIEQGCRTVLFTSRKSDERKDAYAFYQKSGYEIKSSGFVKQLS